MILKIESIERTCSSLEYVEENHDLDKVDIVELGCGAADMTRALAESHPESRLQALEVDAVQHEKNVASDHPTNLRFGMAGAERIPRQDNSVDLVLMFKSFHHIPVNMMGQALREIHRILKPGGMVHISEPLYQGSFNDILRIFHDEEYVRREAFKSIKSSVTTGMFELVKEDFHLSPFTFDSFDAFEEQVMGVTHTDFGLTPELVERVKAAFEAKADARGAVAFEQPIRVDILRKPA